MICTACQCSNPEDARFCTNCGHPMGRRAHGPPAGPGAAQSERKLVTALFSDLTGYTAMSEKLDPEEVREILDRVFGEITGVITKYQGFIEHFAGDAVLAVFGVPQAHEDDAVRAVRAALEINALVEAQSPMYEPRVGRPLSMHSGINTGLVVTGEVDVGKGTHGLTGDAINLASRLEGLAGAGEILVGESTRNLCRDYFRFDAMPPARLKGKAEPVPVFKVISPRDAQTIIARMQGVRAKLIGREEEMDLLTRAVSDLKQGKGGVISIVGDAGTGKSRLTREFRAGLNLEEVQWREGHAYPYTQNTAYYPLTNLLTHAFQVREGDKPSQIRHKVDAGVKALLWDKPETARYLGGLFSLGNTELEEMPPEFWRHNLHQSAQQLLEALVSRGPTVILFEDLHWADASFIELLHSMLEKIDRPVLLVLVYRPSFKLFPKGEPESMAWPHRQIEIRDLSWAHTRVMLQSLLQADHLPDELLYFIQQKAEGNPFYLEEVVNTLIETGALTHDDSGWRVAKPISMLNDIPATIQGVLTARLDRLEKEAKRILQEASVIGRAFFYEVLNRVTELGSPVDNHLSRLESWDLIRTRAREPDLEYIFKHSLTQEVAYNGLLKKERREIHERIGQVMETLFPDRLPEFYETLAFHFSRGESSTKAIHYLIKSGEKNLGRYSVEEANEYFRKAFELLAHKPDRSEDEDLILADVLNNWAYAFYYLGDIKGLLDLLERYEGQVRSLNDPDRYGLYCTWLGIAHYLAGTPLASQDYLNKAIALGEDNDNQKIIGYACNWMAWVYHDLGRSHEGIEIGHRALRILEKDQYMHFLPLSGIGMAYCCLGNIQKAMEYGCKLVDVGEKMAHSRSSVLGHFVHAWGNMGAGDMEASIECAQKSLKSARDPFYSQFPKMALGAGLVYSGQIQKAKDTLGEAIEYFQEHDLGCQTYFCELNLGLALIAEGKMKKGMELMNRARIAVRENHKIFFCVWADLLMAKVYYQLAYGPKPRLGLLANNAGFLVKHVPFASKKAIGFYNKAIEGAEKISALSHLGQACLDLGLIYKFKKRHGQAKEYFERAVESFYTCGAHVFLTQAEAELAQLG